MSSANYQENPTIVFQMDTNLLNAKQRLPDVNQLEYWYDNGIIILIWSEVAQNEAKNTNKINLLKKADTHIYTINDEQDGADSISEKIKIQINEIFGINANSTTNEINDAKIVCEAAKYCAILVTNDGASKSQPKGILGRRDQLSKFVKIVTPQEAVEYVRNKLKLI